MSDLDPPADEHRDEPGVPKRDAGEPAYDPERARSEKSFGNISERHWSRARKDLHEQELAFLRERSRAPGVAEGGADRNMYCMECPGVIPLQYDQRAPADRTRVEHCPHCGAKLDANVRMMFNWVEMDQPPDSDAMAILPFAVGLVVILMLLFLGGYVLFG